MSCCLIVAILMILFIPIFVKHFIHSDFCCQRQIEGQSKCTQQCDHCQKYYYPLEHQEE